MSSLHSYSISMMLIGDLKTTNQMISIIHQQLGEGVRAEVLTFPFSKRRIPFLTSIALLYLFLVDTRVNSITVTAVRDDT